MRSVWKHWSTCEHNDSCFYLPWLSTHDLLQQQSASHSRATRSHLIAACYSCSTVGLTLDPWAILVGVGRGKRLAQQQSTLVIAFSYCLDFSSPADCSSVKTGFSVRKAWEFEINDFESLFMLRFWLIVILCKIKVVVVFTCFLI